MRSTNLSAARSGPLRRLCAWATCLCLLLCSSGCAMRGQTPRPIDLAPASLAAPCDAGPAYPAGPTPLGEVVDVIAGREAAAADCRARHAALVKAWPR